MAGTSAKEIKNRIRSMEATMKITKAMDLVAASKLRKAQERLQPARLYFSQLQKVAACIPSPKTAGGRACCVVMAGDRGLAGGYNANVLKAAAAELDGETAVVPMGKKAADFFENRRFPVLCEEYAQAEAVNFDDCLRLGDFLYRKLRAGELSKVIAVYTRFHSVLSQAPEVLPLLPYKEEKADLSKLFEPELPELADAVLPLYLAGSLYGMLCESQAAEQAARVAAMDAATQNAEEMIDALRLEFNRTRQAAITREITEIIAGAKRS